MQELSRDLFISHAGHYQVYKTSAKPKGEYPPPPTHKVTRIETHCLQESCPLVTVAFLCPHVGECLVCFSCISVIHVVEYQPGK